MVDGSILKCENVPYASHSVLSAKKTNEKLFFDLPTENSVTSLKDSKVEFVFDVKREVR